MKRMVDNTARIKDLDRMGVDMQVISPSLIHHNTTASGLESAETIVRQVNDHLAETVATHPDQLAGMGTVPFQDANRSVKELDRLVNRLGFQSVESLTGNG